MAHFSGHCQCGGVTFKVPTAGFVESCHCAMCRRMTGGGPFFGISCHKGVTITADKTLKWYHSSDWARRGFCGSCGTALFYNLKGSEFYSVSSGSLTLPDDLPLAKEYFIDSKPGYYSLAGERPRFTGEEVMSGVAQANSHD